MQKRCFSIKPNKMMANSVAPDEMAHHKPSHLDLHCALVSVLVCRAEKGFVCSDVHIKE